MPISTSANIIVPRRDVDDQVEGEMTNLLFAGANGLHFATVLLCVLTCALFWFSTNRASLLLWFTYMCTTMVGRYLLSRRFHKETISMNAAGKWRRFFERGNLLTAIGWGFGGLILFSPGDLNSQMLVTVVLLAVLTMVAPTLSPNRKIFVVFAFIAISPLLFRHVLAGSPGNLMAATILIFVFPLLAIYAARRERQIIEELQTRFAYADLARELSGEIAVRRQAENRLTDMANYDQLTGLPNRALLRDRMERAMAKARRHESRIAVLFVDLDGFKNINDTMGHHAGDDVLREIAKRLQVTVRAENTVARLSGDEFIIVLEDVDTLQDTRAAARRILMQLSEPITLDENTTVKLTASIGIALSPDHGKEFDALLQNADIAMYRAKTSGRNGFQIFSQEMHAEALTRLSRENALRRALDNEEFFMVYQPQIDTFSGGYIGAEALIRWESPEYGMVPPSEFIPLAEETGLIKPLGEWAMRTACEQAKRFHAQFGKEFHLSINLSARQLEGDDAIARIQHIIEKSGVPPEALLLEITESIALSNGHLNLIQLRKLRALGIRLALDDFGTGNSSLTYLKRFPINVVKLDKTFIDNITMNREDAAICRATIELANELELLVIAEGVESREQADWLQNHNCFVMQGYLFAPALRANECMAKMVLQDALKMTATEGAALKKPLS